MKRIIIFMSALFLYAATYAQDIKTWDEGPLKWSDFSISEKKGDTTSLSIINFSLADKTVKEGRISYHYWDVLAAFHRKTSWVCEEYITDSELQFNQGIFDLMEINARKYRDSLLFYNGKIQAIQKYFFRTANIEVEQYRNDKNRSSFEIYDDDFDIAKVKWKDSKIGFGMSAGLIVLVPFGALSELVNTAPGLSLNATCYLGKNMVAAEFNYSIGKAKNAYFGTEGIKLGVKDLGESVPIINGSLLAGRFLHQGDNFKLFLVAGPGYFNAQFYNFTTDGLTLTEGIGADFKFHDWLFFLKQPTHYEGDIRVKLSAAQLFQLKEHSIIPMMNLSVSFSLPSWKIFRG